MIWWAFTLEGFDWRTRIYMLGDVCYSIFSDTTKNWPSNTKSDVKSAHLETQYLERFSNSNFYK